MYVKNKDFSKLFNNLYKINLIACLLTGTDYNKGTDAGSPPEKKLDLFLPPTMRPQG